MKELSFLFSLGYEALRTFEKLRLKQPFFFLSKFAASNRNRDISLCLVLDKHKMAEQTLGHIGIYSVFKILQTANNEEKPGRYKTQVTGNRPLFYQYGKYPKHL